MSAVTDILGQLPLSQLAEQLGTNEKDAKTASTHVIKSLLGGLTVNAQQADGEQALASALAKHASTGAALATKGVDLGKIDTKDGAKIVKHVLGADPTTTAAALAAKTGTDQSLLQKLLPILAPIVMAYLAGKVFKGNAAPAQGQSAAGGVEGLLGGLLGGGGGGTSGGGNVLGSLVGGLLGGGGGAAAGGAGGGALGSMLSGVLGDALGNQSQASKVTQAQQSSGGGLLGGLLDAIF